MVVLERMLAGERKSIWTNATDAEDFTVVVESSEGGIKGVERIFSKDVLACDITEVEECI